MLHMLELPDKDFKPIIIKMLWAIMNTLDTNEKENLSEKNKI